TCWNERSRDVTTAREITTRSPEYARAGTGATAAVSDTPPTRSRRLNDSAVVVSGTGVSVVPAGTATWKGVVVPGGGPIGVVVPAGPDGVTVPGGGPIGVCVPIGVVGVIVPPGGN